ncbi:MAG: ABC-F family ATP-binding cassette domain-containing protein [Crocinitomicaceae bacterium]|nr:ABC-F family ATP-binding cassette domain-containing protein [Crocinitomicaceae bacterium]
MNYLSVENLSKSFGIRTIFKDITFGIDKGNKVAIVAKNGQGKTTLLNILSGLDAADSGRLVYRNGIKVDHLEQAENFKTNRSIFEEVVDTDTEETRAISMYEKALLNPEDTEAYEAAFEKMNATNAWDYEVKVSTILSQLGFTDKHQKLDELSGGQKKRVALAKVLINEPDIMILDEPTNHLDLDMIEWLEAYLSKSEATIIMVTHDRYFLEVVCDTILELEDHTLYKYEGNFSYYLQKKAEREEILKATISKAKNLMRTELEWIRRQPKARGTKQKARVDAFDGLKATATQKIKKDEMEIPVLMERLGTKIVELHRVGKWFDDKKLINDFDYTFKRGEKIGIVGKNGSGKSTLLNMIVGKEAPSKGKIVIGDTVKLGYYHQDGMKFKEGQKVIEVIREIAEYIPLEKGRKMSAAQFLEKFLFPRDMHYNYVEKLSGGEKKRLYLMTVLMANPNFLILDEPTNDLDIFTLGVLEDYLAGFGGCVIIVSHDRYFLDKLVDHTFYFRGDGEIKDILGNYTAYRNYLKEEVKQNRAKEKAQKEKIEQHTPKEAELEKKKLTYAERLEFEALEGEMEALENEKVEIAEAMNAGELDGDAFQEKSIRLGQIDKELAEKEDRWLTLSEFA